MPDWGLIAAGLVVLALGLSVALWSLFADRSKGRERCPRCWYDMSGAPGDTAIRCPECGRVAAARREFARTRRRWRTATAFFILAVVGGPLLIVPVIRKSGWWALVPTEVLIRTVDAEGVLTTPGRTEFARRLMAGDVSTRQWAYVLKRAAPSAIKTRAKWPIGVPLVGDVAFPAEFTRSASGNAAVLFGSNAEVAFDPLVLFVGGFSWSGAVERESIDLGVRPDGEPRSATIPIDCAFLLPSAAGVSVNPSDAVRCRVERAIQLTRHAEECIRALGVPSIDEGIRSRVACSIVRTYVAPGTHIREGWMHSLLSRLEDGQPLFSDLGAPCFAARIVFEYDGREVATGEWFIPQHRFAYNLTLFDFDSSTPLRGDCEAVYAADPLDPKWTMKVIGDPNIALRDRKATKYWSGTVQVPFPGQTPVRGP